MSPSDKKLCARGAQALLEDPLVRLVRNGVAPIPLAPIEVQSVAAALRTEDARRRMITALRIGRSALVDVRSAYAVEAGRAVLRETDRAGEHGVFAVAHIEQGDVVFEHTMVIEYNERGAVQYADDDRMIQLVGYENLWGCLDDDASTTLAYKLNSSNGDTSRENIALGAIPSVQPNGAGVGKVIVFALRDIAPGEELAHAYDFSRFPGARTRRYRMRSAAYGASVAALQCA